MALEMSLLIHELSYLWVFSLVTLFSICVFKNSQHITSHALFICPFVFNELGIKHSTQSSCRSLRVYARCTYCHQKMNAFYAHAFIRTYISATDWMFLSPPPNVMVLGDGAFGEWLGHEGRTQKWGYCLHKGDPGKTPDPLMMWAHSKKMVVYEAGSYQTLNLPVPSSWTSLPPELWEIKFSCYKPPRLR